MGKPLYWIQKKEEIVQFISENETYLSLKQDYSTEKKS